MKANERILTLGRHQLFVVEETNGNTTEEAVKDLHNNLPPNHEVIRMGRRISIVVRRMRH